MPGEYPPDFADRYDRYRYAGTRKIVEVAPGRDVNRTIVRGRVLEGGSGSGLAGVSISNGEYIVETDADGTYSLPFASGTHSFVILTLPDGYRARNGFYRSLKGGASVEDFILDRDPETEDRRFSLAQITDTHLTVEGLRSWTGDALRDDLAAIHRKDGPDIVVATGDLTGRGEVTQLETFRKIISSSPIPVMPIFGGHDGNAERKTGTPGTTFVRNYERTLGPICYSFNRGGRHFIAFMEEDYFLSPEDVQRKDRWFRRDLERHNDGRDTVIFMHTPPSGSLLDMLSKYNIKAIFYGHWHSSKVFHFGDTLVAATPPLPFGGIDTAARGYRLVSFDEGSLSSRLRSIENIPRTGNHGGILGTHTARWHVKLPSGLYRASPVSLGDDLLLSIRDEDDCESPGVLCIGSSSGNARWHANTDSSIKNSVAIDGDSGLCAAASVCGAVYLIEATTGRILWRSELPGYPHRWIYTTPIIEGGAVYSGAKAGYAAMGIEDGSSIWYSELEVNDAWPSYASPITHEDMVVALVPRRGLVSMGKEDGGIEWETELPVEYHYAPHVALNDRILTGGERGELVLLDADSGSVVWRGGDLAGRYPTSLMMTDDRILATTSEGYVQCNDVETGRRIWAYQSGYDLIDMSPYGRGGRSILAPLFRSGDDLVICGCDGLIHVVDATKGSQRLCIDLDSPVTAGPCRAPGGICIGTCGGDLYLYDDGAFE